MDLQHREHFPLPILIISVISWLTKLLLVKADLLFKKKKKIGVEIIGILQPSDITSPIVLLTPISSQ